MKKKRERSVSKKRGMTHAVRMTKWLVGSGSGGDGGGG